MKMTQKVEWRAVAGIRLVPPLDFFFAQQIVQAQEESQPRADSTSAGTQVTDTEPPGSQCKEGCSMVLDSLRGRKWIDALYESSFP